MSTSTTKATNTEFLTELMEFHHLAPLNQMFIMEAVARYAAQIAPLTPDALPGMKDGLVSPEDWIKTGKMIHERMEARLK